MNHRIQWLLVSAVALAPLSWGCSSDENPAGAGGAGGSGGSSGSSRHRRWHRWERRHQRSEWRGR